MRGAREGGGGISRLAEGEVGPTYAPTSAADYPEKRPPVYREPKSCGRSGWAHRHDYKRLWAKPRPHPMGCKTYDCPTCADAFAFRRVSETVTRIRAVESQTGPVGAIQVVLTSPQELRNEITLGRVRQFRRAGREVVEAMAREALADQLRPGDRLFLRVALHPAGDREPAVWKPHMHILVLAAALGADGVVRRLDVSSLAASTSRRTLRTRWRALLQRLTDQPCRRPWTSIRTHDSRDLGFVLERELRSFPGWGEAARDPEERRMYRRITRTDWAGGWAPNFWKQGRIIGAEPPGRESLIPTLALTPAERDVVAKGNPDHAVATVIAHHEGSELYRPGDEVAPIVAEATARRLAPPPPPPPPSFDAPRENPDFRIDLSPFMWQATRSHCMCEVCRPSVEDLRQADLGAKFSARALATALDAASRTGIDVTEQRAAAERLAHSITREAQRLNAEPVSVRWAVEAIEAALRRDLAFFAADAWWPDGVSRWLKPSDVRRIRDAVRGALREAEAA